MDQSQSSNNSNDIAAFLRKAARAISRVVRDLSLVTRSLADLLDRIRDNNQWWQQGIGPDSEGVYPQNIFSQKWDDDDPPSFDLSA